MITAQEAHDLVSSHGQDTFLYSPLEISHLDIRVVTGVLEGLKEAGYSVRDFPAKDYVISWEKQ